MLQSVLQNMNSRGTMHEAKRDLGISLQSGIHSLTHHLVFTSKHHEILVYESC